MKRKLVALSGVIALAAFGQNVEAKSLEEVLKDKGLLTDAELKSVTKPADYKVEKDADSKSAPRSTDYKLGKGMTFTSADGKYALTLNQAFQAQYAYTDYELPSKTDVSNVSLRRVKTILSGHAFSKDFTYNASYNMTNLSSTTTNTKAIEEVYIKYRLIDEFQLLVGQTKVQYSRNWITSFRAQQFVDGSFVRSAFYPSFDTGVYALGNILNGKLKYNIAWMGGNGQNTKVSDDSNSYNFRVSIDPLGDMKLIEGDLDHSAKPLVSFGASYYLNTGLSKTAGTTVETNNLGFAGSSGWLGKALAASYFGTAKETLKINSFEADMAFKWLGASLQGEYFWGQADGRTSQKKAVAQGAYIQAGYFVIPKKLELAMRYNWLNYNIFANTNEQVSELQGGVNYFLYGNNLKIQADLTNRHTYKDKTDDLTGRLQAQFIF